MRRKTFLGLIAVVVLLVLGDVLFWHAAARRLEQGFAAWVADGGQHGWTITSSSTSLGGWPLAATLTITDLAVAGGEPVVPGGVFWDTKRLVLRVDGPMTSPLPCTPRGILELLTRHGITLEGANVVVVGRGVTVGRSIGLLLTRRSVNATVTLTHTGTADLAALPRNAPVPRRLVEQAITLGAELSADPASSATLIHSDLHYENVLAAEREPWLVIDPKPLDGDPHYEIAPMLWNRWDELAGYVRDGLRRRFYTLVDGAELDVDRARAWVIVRTMHNAMWELTEHAEPDPDWLTTCVTIAKAVQD